MIWGAIASILSLSLWGNEVGGGQMGRFSRAIYRCTHPHMLRFSIKHADVVSIKHAESCCFPFWRHIETYTSQIMDFQSIHILSTLCERRIKYLLLLLFALFCDKFQEDCNKVYFPVVLLLRQAGLHYRCTSDYPINLRPTAQVMGNRAWLVFCKILWTCLLFTFLPLTSQ